MSDLQRVKVQLHQISTEAKQAHPRRCRAGIVQLVG